MRLWKRVRILKAAAFVTYKEWSAYSVHSLVSVLVGLVSFTVQYFVLTAIYSGRSEIAGLGLEQAIRYFGAAALIRCLATDFADRNLQMLVRTGGFLAFQLRPVHHRFFALSQKVGHRSLGFLLEFLPCLAVFALLFHVDLRPDHYGWTALSVAAAFLMNFYVNYSLGLSAFFPVGSDRLRSAYGFLAGIFAGGLLPLAFFPETVRKLLMFLPFQYTLYVPAMVWTGAPLGLSLNVPTLVGIQCAAVLAAALLSELLYRLAARQFSRVNV
ncbi:MAG: ABC-2 family transporter protein [Clostridium sp.]|jgi:ABC-2 type transport system permease protein|nr:ABC-2 family transporter protein [Clostridium sp.]